MRRYLSVDCGGTKTAFLLCRETGELEAACTLPPELNIRTEGQRS